MNISINKNELMNAIKITSTVVKGHHTVPALEGLLLKAQGNSLTITGSNLDTSITTTLNDFLEVYEEGEIVVEAKLLKQMVQKAPDVNIGIKTEPVANGENVKVHVKSGKSRYTVVGISADLYPLPDFTYSDTAISLNVDGLGLKSCIDTTLYAVATDVAIVNSKPIFSGALFDFQGNELTVVATDGRRMALRRMAVKTSDVYQKFVIPNEPLRIISNLLNKDNACTLHVFSNRVVIEIGTMKIVSRLLEGHFLDYNKLFSEQKNIHAVVKKETFIDSIERIAVLSEKTPLKCSVKTDQKIEFSLNSTLGKSHDELPAINIDGITENLTIGFDAKYFKEALKTCEEEAVQINFAGANEPILISPIPTKEKKVDYMHLVVPMRLATK